LFELDSVVRGMRGHVANGTRDFTVWPLP
jgi:hypothetical protein